MWFDAPIGYISNTIELYPDTWEKWWKDQDTKMIHFIGKDNIVFHCIVFPSMLKAHGGYILPENVPANEFLNLEGEKISTSRNWAVWLHEYLDEFPGKEDVLRYTLCSTTPETRDNDFTWKDFQSRNNNELVAILGNFVNRAVVLTHKYFKGTVPEPGTLTPYDREVLGSVSAMKNALEEHLEHYRFRDSLKEAMNIARLGNKYLADTEPWKVAKTDMERVGTILNISLQLCARLTIAQETFLPFTTKKLRDILNKTKAFPWSGLDNETLLQTDHQLNEPVLLFDKIDDDAIVLQTDKLKKPVVKKVVPASPECTIDDFEKMDIRVATVLHAERVPKTDKLLKLTIDTGLDRRVIVSGIAGYYTPEEMTGKQICILANLSPRTIRGIESQGMILMAKEPDGSMRVVSPEDKIGNGAVIG